MPTYANKITGRILPFSGWAMLSVYHTQGTLHLTLGRDAVQDIARILQPLPAPVAKLEAAADQDQDWTETQEGLT
jgi:hypothetical protein